MKQTKKTSAKTIINKDKFLAFARRRFGPLEGDARAAKGGGRFAKCGRRRKPEAAVVYVLGMLVSNDILLLLLLIIIMHYIFLLSLVVFDVCTYPYFEQLFRPRPTAAAHLLYLQFFFCIVLIFTVFIFFLKPIFIFRSYIF